jgi:hypothetical protein
MNTSILKRQGICTPAKLKRLIARSTVGLYLNMYRIRHRRSADLGLVLKRNTPLKYPNVWILAATISLD